MTTSATCRSCRSTAASAKVSSTRSEFANVLWARSRPTGAPGGRPHPSTAGGGARYEAELAHRRYLCGNPDNRQLTGSLEADWSNKRRALAAGPRRLRPSAWWRSSILRDEYRKQGMAPVADFLRPWRDAATPQRERKRMVRLLLEDVPLLNADDVVVRIHFRGGATRTVDSRGRSPPISGGASIPRWSPEIDRLLKRPHRLRDRRHPDTSGLRGRIRGNADAAGVSHTDWPTGRFGGVQQAVHHTHDVR